MSTKKLLGFKFWWNKKIRNCLNIRFLRKAEYECNHKMTKLNPHPCLQTELPLCANKFINFPFMFIQITWNTHHIPNETYHSKHHRNTFKSSSILNKNKTSNLIRTTLIKKIHTDRYKNQHKQTNFRKPTLEHKQTHKTNNPRLIHTCDHHSQNSNLYQQYASKADVQSQMRSDKNAHTHERNANHDHCMLGRRKDFPTAAASSPKAPIKSENGMVSIISRVQITVASRPRKQRNQLASRIQENVRQASECCEGFVRISRGLKLGRR